MFDGLFKPLSIISTPFAIPTLHLVAVVVVVIAVIAVVDSSSLVGIRNTGKQTGGQMMGNDSIHIVKGRLFQV